MKKLLSLLLALVLLVSAVPAFAATLTPEDVIGTWEQYVNISNGNTLNTKDLKKLGVSRIFQFHADGTGKTNEKLGKGKAEKRPFTWTIKGNIVTMTFKDNSYLPLTKKGKDLAIILKLNSGNSLVEKYRKTSESSGKTVKQAILSTGTYKLNNSKKTAAFTAPANKKAKTLVIPDTIKANGKTYKVTEISAKACASMSKLTTLTIGKNVKTIGANAFSKCKKLNKITINTTSLSKVGAGAFSNVKSSGTVTCPKKKASKYQKLLQKGGLPKKFKVKGK